MQGLISNGLDTKKVQMLGTGLWEDAQIFANPQLDGAWYAGPDSTGFKGFAARYKAKYGTDPVRTASLTYDAVALVAALTKTQGNQRFSEEVLTNVVGLHRHRRAVPLPAGRHQPARPVGDEGDAERRPGHQPAAEGVRRLGDLTSRARPGAKSASRRDREYRGALALAVVVETP